MRIIMSISNIALIGTYPNEGKGQLLNSLVREWKENNKQVILALDEESLQLGLTNYITRLIEGGYVNHLILTGNALIQDFLNAGGEREKIDEIIKYSKQYNTSLAVIFAAYIKNLENKEYSILYSAFEHKIKTSIHLIEALITADNIEYITSAILKETLNLKYALEGKNIFLVNLHSNPNILNLINNLINITKEITHKEPKVYNIKEIGALEIIIPIIVKELR